MRKITVCVCAAFLLVFTGARVEALEPLGLYDDFNTPRINPDKWIGDEFPSGTPGSEALREIRGKRLRIAYRGYGRIDSDTGLVISSLSETLTTSSAITAVEATVQVSKLDFVGCAANPNIAFVVAQVAGAFFNTATPIPGSRANDVGAVIEIRRLSNSTDPLNVFRVAAFVFQCTDAFCATPTFLGFQDLGTVKKNNKARVRVQWDPDNDQFIFQRDSNPEVLLPYTVPDTMPPSTNIKHLIAINGIPNCTATTRPVGFVDATFDDVFVNESAVP